MNHSLGLWIVLNILKKLLHMPSSTKDSGQIWEVQEQFSEFYHYTDGSIREPE